MTDRDTIKNSNKEPRPIPAEEDPRSATAEESLRPAAVEESPRSEVADESPHPLAAEDGSHGDVLMQLPDHLVKPKYRFEDFGDYWSCSCGQINRSDTCSNCGLERELLRRLFQNNGIEVSLEDDDIASAATPSSDASDATGGQKSAVTDPSRFYTVVDGSVSLDPEGTDSGTAREAASEQDGLSQEVTDGIDEDQEATMDLESIAYDRRKRRTRRLMVFLVLLICMLGGGLAAFYFYGLPEMNRQADMEADTAKDSLASELPETVKPLGENEFEINRNLGDYYYDKKEYEKAIDYYNKALKIESDESIRHKIEAAKYSYVSSHQEEGGAVFEDYLEDLYKAKYSGIQDIYNRYYTWKASTVTNTGPSDYSTDMSTIDRVNTIYFHTTFSGGPPKDSLDLYYEIVWPDGTSERRAVSGRKESGETLTTNCTYTFPATPNEGRLTYKLFNNTTNKQISSDSVSLR